MVMYGTTNTELPIALFTSLKDFFLKHYHMLLFLVFLFLLTAVLLTLYFDMRLFIRVTSTGVYLEELISNGDWLTVYCTIDTLSECTHSHSLLIKKDVRNLEYVI